MQKINLNKLAQDVTLAEGKKVVLPIGQVKEVIKVTLELLKKYPFMSLAELFTRKK